MPPPQSTATLVATTDLLPPFQARRMIFLGAIISFMGIKIVKFSEDDLNNCTQGVLVNCVKTPPSQLVARVWNDSSGQASL